MERMRLAPVPEECRHNINHLASYLLHISDIYLSMVSIGSWATRSDIDNWGSAIQALTSAVQKEKMLQEILEDLKKVVSQTRETERPEIGNWGNAIEALTSALQMENVITKNLEDLNTLATNANDAGLLKFLKDFLIKQKRNTDYLERQISYEHQSEEMRRQETSEMTS
ncbi:ferritin, higher subunit-like [Marmota flaviventris]|uniref:ferritin, higher subunit-like n=1 Tax=Marmota flaviventris TaxID=93162 RepID=UPI003A885F66